MRTYKIPGRLKKILALIGVAIIVIELVMFYGFGIRTTGIVGLDKAMIAAFFTVPVMWAVLALSD